MNKRFATLLTALAFGQSLTLLTTPAHAGNDKKALSLAEKAIYEDYLNLEFDGAKKKLEQAIELCEADCNPANTAKVYREMGVLLVAGMQDHAAGVAMFVKALEADSMITLDADLSTPEIEAAFEEAKGQAPNSALGAAMRDSVDENAEGAPPEEEDPLLAKVAAEQEEEPEPEPAPRGDDEEIELEPEPESSEPAEKLDLDQSDCPPDFPGCTSFEDEWAAEEAEEEAKRFPRHWFSVGFQQEFLILDATTTACTGNNYQCYYAGDVYRDPTLTTGVTDPITGVTSGTGDIGGGLTMATSRVMVGYDFGITPEFLIGVRGGFAFGGGPQKVYQPTVDPITGLQTVPPAPGKQFQPIHAELRASYWFLGVKSGFFRPYAQLGGGMAQVDAKVSTPIVDSQPSVVANCTALGRELDPTCYNAPLDAWKKTGTVFLNIGVGTLLAFGDNHGLIIEAKGMQMLGASGLAAAFQGGYAFGL